MRPPAINNAAIARSISNSPPVAGKDSIVGVTVDEVVVEVSSGIVAGAVGVPFMAFDAGESPIALTALMVIE
jgi:hypothetical protein